MAKTLQDNPSLVSLYTDYEEKSVRVLVAGKGGSLALKIYTDNPTIGVRDPERGELRYKAVVTLEANGHLKGWFVEHKGATPREDTLVFFPAGTGEKPLPEARRVKK